MSLSWSRSPQRLRTIVNVTIQTTKVLLFLNSIFHYAFLTLDSSSDDEYEFATDLVKLKRQCAKEVDQLIFNDSNGIDVFPLFVIKIISYRSA